MFRKLLLILLAGMVGQLAGMQTGRSLLQAPVIDFDLKREIDAIVEDMFNPNTYNQLTITQKLAQTLNALLTIHSLVQEVGQPETLYAIKAAELTFNEYLSRNVPRFFERNQNKSEVLNSLTSAKLMELCLFFLEYANEYILLKKTINWKTVLKGYSTALGHLVGLSLGILIRELEKDKQNLDSLQGSRLVEDMGKIVTILSPGLYFGGRFRLGFTTYLKPVILDIHKAISAGDLKDGLLTRFEADSKYVAKEVTIGMGSYEKLISLYLAFARELQKKMKPAAVSASVSTPAPASAAFTPPPATPPQGRIEQIREWAKRNWKPVTAGLTATIAAAGYAAYRWLTGKPATK